MSSAVLISSSGRRGPLVEQKMVLLSRNASKTRSFHQLRWRNSTTFLRSGSSDFRIRASAGAEYRKLGGSWKRKQPKRLPSKSAINPKSRTSSRHRTKRLVCVISSFTFTVYTIDRFPHCRFHVCTVESVGQL